MGDKSEIISLFDLGEDLSWELGDHLVTLARSGDSAHTICRANPQLTSFSYGKLRELQKVSELIPKVARNGVKLPWAFFRECADLPDGRRDRLLHRAAEAGWGIVGLRREAATFRQYRPKPTKKTFSVLATFQGLRRFVRQNPKAKAEVRAAALELLKSL